MAKVTPQEAVKKHEKRMHPGKTPSYKKGGPTSEGMMKMGRNMARIANQGGK